MRRLLWSCLFSVVAGKSIVQQDRALVGVDQSASPAPDDISGEVTDRKVVAINDLHSIIDFPNLQRVGEYVTFGGSDATHDGGQIATIYGPVLEEVAIGTTADKIIGYQPTKYVPSGNIFDGGQAVFMKLVSVDKISIANLGDTYKGGLELAVDQAVVGSLRVGGISDKFEGGQAIVVGNSSLGMLYIGERGCVYSGGLTVVLTLKDKVNGVVHAQGDFSDGQNFVVTNRIVHSLYFGDSTGSSKFRGGLSVKLNTDKVELIALQGSFHDGQRIAVAGSTLSKMQVGAEADTSMFTGGLSTAVEANHITAISFKGNYSDGQDVYLRGKVLGFVDIDGVYTGGQNINVEVPTTVALRLGYDNDKSVFKGGLNISVKSDTFDWLKLVGEYHDGQNIVVASPVAKTIEIGNAQSVFRGGLTIDINSTNKFEATLDGTIEGDVLIVLVGTKSGRIVIAETCTINGNLTVSVFDSELSSAQLGMDRAFLEYFDKQVSIKSATRPKSETLVVNGLKFVRGQVPSANHEIVTDAELRRFSLKPKAKTLVFPFAEKSVPKDVTAPTVASMMEGMHLADKHKLELAVNYSEARSFTFGGTRNTYNGHQTIIVTGPRVTSTTILMVVSLVACVGVTLGLIIYCCRSKKEKADEHNN